MPKVLFVANVYEHIVGFHLPYMKWLKEHGYEVHVVANDLGDYQVPYADKVIEMGIERSPIKISNLKAIKQLRQLIDNEKYSLISCHTPMGGVVARLAARKARKKFGLKVIYTTHGLHFYGGAPKKNWLVFYPIEKFLSHYTDAIVTINSEDFELINKKNFKNKKTYRIHGIGINISRLGYDKELNLNELREKYGYKPNDFILLYMAEFISGKNHKFLLKTMPELIKKIPNIKMVFAGRGEDKEKTMLLAKNLGVEKEVNFIGRRSDVGNLIKISDIGISSSIREGLGMSVAESLYLGRPVVVSNIRGHRDLVQQGKNGFLFDLNDKNDFIDKIVFMYENPEKREEMGRYAMESMEEFLIDNSLNDMAKIYSEVKTL